MTRKASPAIRGSAERIREGSAEATKEERKRRRDKRNESPAACASGVFIPNVSAHVSRPFFSLAASGRVSAVTWLAKNVARLPFS